MKLCFELGIFPGKGFELRRPCRQMIIGGFEVARLLELSTRIGLGEGIGNCGLDAFNFRLTQFCLMPCVIGNLNMAPKTGRSVKAGALILPSGDRKARRQCRQGVTFGIRQLLHEPG